MKCEFLLCDGQCVLSEMPGNACGVDGSCLKMDNMDIHCDYYDEEDHPEICENCLDKKGCAVATALKK